MHIQIELKYILSLATLVMYVVINTHVSLLTIAY